MIMTIDSDHLFDSTCNIAETHNLLTILYYFVLFFTFLSDLHPFLATSQKMCNFFAKDTLVFINFVVKCSFANQGNVPNIIIKLLRF